MTQEQTAVTANPAVRAERLREEIARHNRLYHALDAPVISDGEFDSLMAELRGIERSHPEVAAQDSPTRTVGTAPDSNGGRQRVEHVAPMLSLSNVFDEGGLDRLVCEDVEAAAGRPVDLSCGDEIRWAGGLVAIRGRRTSSGRPPAGTAPSVRT